MKKQVISLILAMTMAATSLAGCGGKTQGEEEAPGKETAPVEEAAAPEVGISDVKEEATVTTEQVDNMVVILPQASFSLAPFSSGRISGMVYHILWGTLMVSPYLGAPLEEMEYRMAKEVTKVSDTVYDVEIYDYIKDSQGNPITADDVVFSYEYGKSIAYRTALNSVMESVEKLDDYTVEFTLKNGAVGAIESLLNGTDIVSRAWFESASDEEKGQNPATTGAYSVESVTSGSGFILVANDDYWQTDSSLRTGVDKQNSKRITFTAITEMAMVAVALENGEIDYGEIDGTVSDTFINEDGTAKEGFSFLTYEVPRFNCIEFNCSEDSPLNNQDLRQAVAYALDSEQLMLAANVPLGMGTVCHDFGNAAGGGYNSEWDKEDYYDYNLEKAKECFEKSGYEEGLELHLLFAISTAPNVPIAIQTQLSQIGINVVIDSVEQALYDTMILESDQWDMATRLITITDYVTSGWASRFDENIYGEQGTGNFVHDDKLQELLHTAMGTQSAEDIEACHDYMTEMCYSIGTYTANKCLIAQDNILSYGGLYEGNPIYNGVDYADGYVSAASN